MTTNYPGSLDSFTNPTSADNLATAGGSTAIPHASQHSNLNDAVLAIQTKLNTSGNHSTAGVVFLDTNKNLVSTPQGNAGQFLMSYGPIANGGPEWISLPIVEIVRAATTTTLTGTWVYANNIPGTTPATLTYTGSSYTIDGYSFTAGDRVLIKDQTSSSTPTYVANGVYIITNIGTSILLTRDNDSDTMGKIGGTIVSVENGNANGGTLWQSTNSSSNTLGTTPIIYNNAVTSTGGSGIAGQLLMSYGGYGLNAPEWVSIASMERASVATTTALAGTYANNNPGTTPSTLTITATGVLTIDGYTTQLGDRILVKDQLVGSTPTYIANGVYVVTTAGATGVSAVLTRDNDSDTMGKLSAMPISIDQGATNGGLAWFNTNKITDTMGTTPVSYSKFLFSNSPTLTTPTIATINAGGTGVAASLFPDVTTGSISIGTGVTGAGTITIGNTGTTVAINGNLTVTGTTETVNSTTLVIQDKNIEIGKVATPADTTANGGGVLLYGTTNKTVTWDLTNANWTSSENFNLATGKVFKINNVSVLSATALGTSVTSSSLTSFGSSPTLVTPNIGVATATSINGLTLTSSAAGFTIAGGTTSKTLTLSNTLTLAGTDTSTLNIGTGGTLGSAAFTASTAYLSSSVTSLPLVTLINGTTIPSTANLVTSADSSVAIPTQTANSGKYLTTNGTSLSWGTVAGGFTNPMTTAGDIIYGGTSGAPTRLAGSATNNFVLTYNTSTNAPFWAVSSGYSTITLGSTALTSGATVTTVAGLTLTAPTINGATLSGTLSGAHTISGVATFSASPVISTITNTGTITFPTTSDTLVGRATTDTLTNKDLTSFTNKGSNTLGLGAVSTNLAVSADLTALSANTTGVYNVAVGQNALKSNTVGNYNTAMGQGSLQNNTTGTNNTAIGESSLYNNTTGGYNTAMGESSLYYNTTGTYNTAVGQSSLYANTIGTSNTAVGQNSLSANTTGIQNTAIGHSSLTGNTTGTNNTAIGTNSLISNATGSSNTAVGYSSLFANTTGSSNTAIGQSSLYTNTIGTSNTAVGYSSLSANTTGIQNTAIGTNSLISNATGVQNTAVGQSAGSTLTTGSNNTLLGYSAAPSSITVSNEITLGNASIATLRCQVTAITALSDLRDKKDVVALPVGLDFINGLKPVTFTWNMRQPANPELDDNGKPIIIGKVGQKDFGFIAQDIIAAEDALQMADTLQLSFRNNPEQLEVTIGRLIPILVKAIQELSAEIVTLKTKVGL